jgi:hypothetical protein
MRIPSLAAALLPHAQLASMFFDKEARRRDPPFYYSYYKLFSFQMVMQCHQTSFILHTDPSTPIHNSGQLGFRSRLTVSLDFSALSLSRLLASVPRTGYECTPSHTRTLNTRNYTSRLAPYASSALSLL